jgi:hypothetical protein
VWPPYSNPSGSHWNGLLFFGLAAAKKEARQ